MSEHHKFPRVFTSHPLTEGAGLSFEGEQHHYLKNVLRVETGAGIRVFNGQDGEFLVNVREAGKKTVLCLIGQKIREQKHPSRKIHLLFAPIKKERMDFLVEKAVELGATDLHIVLTQNTDIRKVNTDRLKLQIVEAAEQCERLDIPLLHNPEDLFKKLSGWDKTIPVLAALERADAAPIDRTLPKNNDCAVLIGPSGGFTTDEKERLSKLGFVKPVSLGDTILRSETAATMALSLLR